MVRRRQDRASATERSRPARESTVRVRENQAIAPMHLAHALARLWLAVPLALGIGGGDRPRRAGRIVSSAVAAAASQPRALPRFVLTGWLSPPVGFTDAARVAELAGVGLNVMLPAPDDSGRREHNLHRLDLAATHGLRCIVWDQRFEVFERWAVDSPEGIARLDSIVADYRDHPAFLGYALGDEPPIAGPVLTPLHAALRARDPQHPPWNNLLGRMAFHTRAAWLDYTRGVADSLGLAMLCNDHYDFLERADRAQFVENVAGLCAVARERGIPFWAIVQLVQHRGYRAITPGELRWQVSHLLAYGARGVGYFTYWTPRPDTTWDWQPAVIARDGSRTPWYDLLAGFDPLVRNAGETIAGMQWIATEHAGSVPVGGTAFEPDGWVRAVAGRAALGEFVDQDGVPHVLVANSDSASARTIGLTVDRPIRAFRLGATAGQWNEIPATIEGPRRRVDLMLEAGAFALLRLEGAGGDAIAGHGPRLTLYQNPARGMLELRVSRVAERGRIELFDALGRRVWGRTLAQGATEVRWNGEREPGGRAGPGLYFVRAEDERGVAMSRVTWLGR
jgi:hypothetical protein